MCSVRDYRVRGARKTCLGEGLACDARVADLAVPPGAQFRVGWRTDALHSAERNLADGDTGGAHDAWQLDFNSLHSAVRGRQRREPSSPFIVYRDKRAGGPLRTRRGERK